ncbi:D12 class N6 adenine-specific DNA methyltransferase family protein [Orientia tsutsugamushi str. UT76]|nr:D12 class N6 adenine-specific DNA methyltransferase family protein [Orientia tsutsugamushi str. UT76]
MQQPSTWCINLCYRFFIYRASTKRLCLFRSSFHKSGERFYTRLPFDEKDQIRLRDFVQELTNKGVKIMISNNNTAFIRDLYKILISIPLQSYTQSMNNAILLMS